MDLLILSFVAGVLTVLAPCILPLLPVIVGGASTSVRDYKKPFIITASLAASIFIFSLLLKATTTLLGVPPMVWQVLSGGIIIIFGLSMLFEDTWVRIAAGFNAQSNKLLGRAAQRQGIVGNILIGAALGPVFSSCSPTYALIVAGILPVSFGKGILYLAAYVVGLSAVLLLIGFAGQQVVAKLGWASNPRGWFKRTLAIIFILVGLGVLLGLDKTVQSYVLDQGWYDWVSNLEERFLGH